MAAMAPVVVEHVKKSFKQGDRTVLALNDVSLQVEQGQFVAIMGASGSGKSTLLHLMSALAMPDSGRVVVDGKDLSILGDHALTLFRRRHIGLVFQSFNLIPTLSAEENILLPLLLDGRQDAAKVGELLDRLGLASRRHHRPDALSGGEQQRVAIGRALVADPAVILADEPTGNLDSVNSKAVCELLRDLSVIHGKTVVMVTHEPAVAAYATSVVVVKDGKLLEQFSTEHLQDRSDLANRYQSLVQ